MTSVLMSFRSCTWWVSQGPGAAPRPRFTSRSPAGSPNRALIDCARPTLRLAPRHPRSPKSSTSRVHSSSHNTVTASSACAIATMRSGRSGQTVELLVAERDWEPPRPRFATTRSSVTRRLPTAVRDPGEAGRWDVESRVTGLATALRSRGRARLHSRIVDEPHPIVDARAERRESPYRCPGAIQGKMLASLLDA